MQAFVALRFLIPIGLGVLSVSSCATVVDGEPTGMARSANGSAIESTTVPSLPKSAVPLPFIPKIKERTNERNNQTTFEPCTAYAGDELRAISIDPSTVRDAAQTDSPNYRGCRWTSITSSPPGRDHLIYAQIVGKRETLDQYKREQSFRQFREERIVLGRRMAVAATQNDCAAIFEVETTTAVTMALPSSPSPGLTRECDAAVALASLGVSKAL